VSPGQVLTYTILVKNAGRGSAMVALTDTLPSEVVYIPGSAWAGSGGPAVYDDSTHRLTWSGHVPVNGMATVRFAVQATGRGGGLPAPITNRVLLDDGAGNVIEKRVTTGGGEYRLFLPLLMHPWKLKCTALRQAVVVSLSNHQDAASRAVRPLITLIYTTRGRMQMLGERAPIERRPEPVEG